MSDILDCSRDFGDNERNIKLEVLIIVAIIVIIFVVYPKIKKKFGGPAKKK